MKKPSSLVLTPLFLLMALTISSNGFEAPRRVMGALGGWKPIDDASDPHVLAIGTFAVAEHNRRRVGGSGALGFGGVVKGERQVVSGMNYRLVVAARDEDGKVGEYEAVVWEENAREAVRKLTSFKPLLAN